MLNTETVRDTLRERARSALTDSADIKVRLRDECLDSILAAAELLARTLEGGGKILLCGNGGSAADCQHLAAEFVGRLSRELERRPLAAVALTTDSSFLTAQANDVGFESVFARQVEALGSPGDALVAITTSGSSPNVLAAARAARACGLSTVGLMGAGGALAALVDVAVRVPSTNAQRVQEAHLSVEHILCDVVEQRIFGPAVVTT